MRNAAVWLLLLVAALPRAWIAWTDHGIFWPDEIYQSLEPAHLFAFGYGVRAWEFEAGARSWLFPGFLGLVLKLLALAGVDHGLALATGARLIMVVISLAGVYGTLRLAQVMGGPAAGVLGGLFAAAFPLQLLFGSRCMGEVASGTLLVFAALALAHADARRPMLAGALSAAAVFVRYTNGVVLLGFIAWLVALRRWADLRRFAAAAAGVGLLGGMLDWATWGAPFHSIRAYLQYNLVENLSTQYGVAETAYYVFTLGSATGPAVLALALGLALAGRRAAAPLAVALAYVLVHSAIAHKEIRFLLPVVPLLLAVAATGLASALAAARLSVPMIAGVGTVLAAAMLHRATTLTFADAGQYRGQPAGTLAPWHATEGVNRLLDFAGRRADLCGIWVTGVRGAWTGGYSYLHRRVPIRYATQPASAAAANYALAPAASLPFPLAGPAESAVTLPPEFVRVAESRGWHLYRREGGCG
jgi:phosphatidylinositol glycan class B